MYVQTYMTSDLVTIPSYQDAAEALRVMRRHGIRRLPVLDQGKMVGIVYVAWAVSCSSGERQPRQGRVAADVPDRQRGG